MALNAVRAISFFNSHFVLDIFISRRFAYIFLPPFSLFIVKRRSIPKNSVYLYLVV